MDQHLLKVSWSSLSGALLVSGSRTLQQGLCCPLCLWTAYFIEMINWVWIWRNTWTVFSLVFLFLFSFSFINNDSWKIALIVTVRPCVYWAIVFVFFYWINFSQDSKVKRSFTISFSGMCGVTESTVAAVTGTEVTGRFPVNTSPEDCKPVIFLTTPNDGHFRACVSVSSKTQHKAGWSIQLTTALNKRWDTKCFQLSICQSVLSET